MDSRRSRAGAAIPQSRLAGGVDRHIWKGSGEMGQVDCDTGIAATTTRHRIQSYYKCRRPQGRRQARYNRVLLASDGNFWVADFNGSTGYGDIIPLSPADSKLIQALSPFGAPTAVGSYPVEIIQAQKMGRCGDRPIRAARPPRAIWPTARCLA